MPLWALLWGLSGSFSVVSLGLSLWGIAGASLASLGAAAWQAGVAGDRKLDTLGASCAEPRFFLGQVAHAYMKLTNCMLRHDLVCL